MNEIFMNPVLFSPEISFLYCFIALDCSCGNKVEVFLKNIQLSSLLYILTFSISQRQVKHSVQFSCSGCLILCEPMNLSVPDLPVHHQLPEFTKTHAHRVADAIQPSHSLFSPSPPAPTPSQDQGLFQWVNSSHEVAKVLELQLQHQSFQWTPRTDLL